MLNQLTVHSIYDYLNYAYKLVIGEWITISMFFSNRIITKSREHWTDTFE